MKKIKPNIWKLSFLGLSKKLNLLTLISLIFIILFQTQKICEKFEYILFRFNPVFFEILSVIAEFISILSYAIITSYLFYYITHQLPLTKKKIRIAEFFSNSIPFIQAPMVDLEFDIFKNSMIPLNEDDYNSHCEKIKLDKPVREHLTNCISWEKLIIQCIEKIIKKIDEVHNLTDIMDTEIFITLQHIKSDCITILNLLSLRNRSLRDDKNNLSHISGLLFSVRKKLILLGSETEKFIYLYTCKDNFKSSI